MFFLGIKRENVIETIRTESNTIRSYANGSMGIGQRREENGIFFLHF